MNIQQLLLRWIRDHESQIHIVYVLIEPINHARHELKILVILHHLFVLCQEGCLEEYEHLLFLENVFFFAEAKIKPLILEAEDTLIPQLLW